MTLYHLGVVIGAVLLDFLIGDPPFLPHPVVFMGKLISSGERFLRKRFPKTPSGEFIAGAILWLFVVAVSTTIPFAAIFFLRRVSLIASFALEVFWASQCLAARCMEKEAKNVFSALAISLEKSRAAVSRIVGRDTQRLDDAGVIRACVETVAENTTDGVISPLLFLIFFGTSGAFFYKAINTLDSMIAYKNSRYRYFGTFAAHADDAANFIPARIAAALMICASGFLRLDFRGAMRIYLRDRKKHSSPNSAHTESVVAGALGVRLAGDAYYEGKLERKDYIGDDKRKIERNDIKKAISLMYLTYFLAILLYIAVFFAAKSLLC